MTVPYNQPWGAAQILTAGGVIDLPTPAYPGQLCWYALSAITTPEISWGAADDGIKPTAAGILGPFRIASAPKHLKAGSATVLVLVS